MMRLMKQCLVVLAVVSICVSDVTKENVQANKDMVVDLALIIDCVPYVDGTHPLEYREAMQEWVEKLWEEQHLREAIGTKKMKVSVIVAHAYAEVDVIPFSDDAGSKVFESVSCAKNNDEKSIENSATGADIKDYMKKVIEKVRTEEKVFENGRPFAPDVAIYMGLLAASGSRFIPTMTDEFADEADIVVMVDKWKPEPEHWAVAHKQAGRWTHTIGSGSLAQEELVKAIKNVLIQCNYTLQEDEECYYEGVNVCVRNVTYVPMPLVPKSEEYCLVGDNTHTCLNRSFCEDTCASKDNWTECDCETKQQSVSLTKPDPKYKYCDPSRTVRKCTPVGCPTEVDADVPPLMMPVWAIFVVTFSIIVILDVLLTLCIYYACFPAVKDIEGSSTNRRTWTRRFDNTMRSFMPSVHTRAGPSYRGDGQSMAPSTRPPYTDVSRTRR